MRIFTLNQIGTVITPNYTIVLKPRLYRLSYIFLLLFAGLQLQAQVVINEFSASNASILRNEFGKFGDWIELYNAGTSDVNLYRYGLSDDAAVPSKWRFPKVVLPAQQFITVFADDTSKLTYLNHWETPASAYDLWRYVVPTATTDTNWRNLSFSDLSWTQGRGGFGYSDGDDSTVLQNANCVYLRKRFSLSDTGQIVKALLSIDYDDGFVAYLNGIEIARSNLGTPGIRPQYDELSFTDHEAQMYQGGFVEDFFIDEMLLKKAMRIGTNVLAIEVHNVTTASTDLTAIPFFSIGVLRNYYLFPGPGT